MITLFRGTSLQFLCVSISTAIKWVERSGLFSYSKLWLRITFKSSRSGQCLTDKMIRMLTFLFGPIFIDQNLYVNPVIVVSVVTANQQRLLVYINVL